MSSPDPFDDDFDDLGLEPREPKDMGNSELADALASFVRANRDAFDAAARSLLDETEHRLRLQSYLRNALVARCEDVQRLQAENERLRGGPPAEDILIVAKWRREVGR